MKNYNFVATNFNLTSNTTNISSFILCIYKKFINIKLPSLDLRHNMASLELDLMEILGIRFRIR